MKLDAAARPLTDAVSGRFLLVSYLPTFAAAFLLLVLVWAGAPGPTLRFGEAWRTAAGIGIGEVLLIALAVTLVAVLSHPLQLGLVRLLEGGWPAWLGSGLTRRLEANRRRRLAQRTVIPEEPTPAQVNQAGAAANRLAHRFPPEDLLRPTALGNALAAMEHTAGAPYGLDAVVAWPRLYPALGDRVRAIVDDRRDTMDAAARFSVTAAATGLASVALLLRSGWWLLLALVPFAVAWAAYLGAVHAALAHGEAVRVAFDLHRFDLLTALHLPLPDSREAERASNEELCTFWRQGKPIPLAYRHG